MADINNLLYILASTFLVSLMAFAGLLLVSLKEKSLKNLLLTLVALSAGVLMGSAFLHLVPEAIEKFGQQNVFAYVLLGFVLFFFIEKVLHWRHCHNGNCDVHTFAQMNITGDAIHNFIDGIIIATSYAASARLGLLATLAVMLHEIPQEIGDFGVLIYGGLKKGRALFWNFISALFAVSGGLFGYFLFVYSNSAIKFLLPLAAGGFIYIAASDLIPEMRKEISLRKSLLAFVIFVFGVAIMFALKYISN